jgi:hypothetical protein
MSVMHPAVVTDAAGATLFPEFAGATQVSTKQCAYRQVFSAPLMFPCQWESLGQ